jgi:hypothetical protein
MQVNFIDERNGDSTLSNTAKIGLVASALTVMLAGCGRQDTSSSEASDSFGASGSPSQSGSGSAGSSGKSELGTAK